jgi:hypothetical protein
MKNLLEKKIPLFLLTMAIARDRGVSKLSCDRP